MQKEKEICLVLRLAGQPKFSDTMRSDFIGKVHDKLSHLVVDPQHNTPNFHHFLILSRG